MGRTINPYQVAATCLLFPDRVQEDRLLTILPPVASEYISATLDIIGVAALGVELHNLESKTSFKECFNRIFDPSTLGLVLWAISSLIPIRWLPLEENRRFEEATTTMHRLTREIIRDRIRDMQAEEDGEKEKVERQDLLTFMLEEDIGSGQVKWSEDDLLGHVGDVFSLRYLACYARR